MAMAFIWSIRAKSSNEKKKERNLHPPKLTASNFLKNRSQAVAFIPALKTRS